MSIGKLSENDPRYVKERKREFVDQAEIGSYGPRKKGRRYPWKRWFSQKTFTLIKGVDFDGRTMTFVGQIRNKCLTPAFPYRITIQVADDESVVVVHVKGVKRQKSRKGK